MKKSLFRAAVAIAALALPAAGHAQVARTPLHLAGDEISSVTYAVGGALCHLMNRADATHRLRCAIEATAGSAATLAALRRGDFHLALVSGDLLHHAANGTGPFASEGPDRDLRAVAYLHSRALTVLGRKEANIRSGAELPGKRVNLGRPGSSTRIEVDEILAAAKLGPNPFILISDLGPEEQGAALCDGRFDAFVFSTGTPSPVVQYPAAACGARLASYDGPVAQRLVDERPYYRFVTIPGGTYPNNPQDVRTLGVPTVLVATSATPPQMVEAVLGQFVANLELLRQLHPALATLTPESLAAGTPLAPLHPAAEAAYRAKGWIR